MTFPAADNSMMARLSLRSAWSTLMQSISQIFFKSHWPTGLLILAAFATYDVAMAALVLLGAASAAASAALSAVKRTDIVAGTQGFCGALVGAAAFASLGATGSAALVALIGGTATIPVTLALAALFRLPLLRRFDLPYTTAPFCLVSGIMLVLTTDIGHQDVPPAPEGQAAIERFIHVLMTSISEVVLMDSVLAGAIILLALFVAHWKIGLASLLGGAMESGSALLLGEPHAQIYHGLAGYSGVLVAIALATIFIAGTWQPWVVAVAGLLLLLPVGALFDILSVPIYTWPYVVTTWLVLVIVGFIPGVHRTS